MKKYILFPCLIACMALASCNSSKTGPVVLTGEIIGSDPGLTVLAYTQDAFVQYLYPEVEDGRFRLELEDVRDFVDFGVGLGEEVYGAHVSVGDSLHMICTPAGDGTYEIEYRGKDEDVSRMFTDFYNTYGYWGQYNIRLDPDPDMTVEDSFKLIDENDAAFRAKYGRRLGKYYSHRADLMCRFFKAALLEVEDTDKGIEYLADPVYIEQVGAVDPDDPTALACGLINRWARVRAYTMPGDGNDKALAFIDSRDGSIKSLEARQMITNLFCHEAVRNMETPDDAYFFDFFDRMAEYIKEDSAMVQDCRDFYFRKKASLTVVNMPEITLQKPDGSTIQLSSLYGKAVYIDVWASWCGPCCREIPHLAQIVEKLKDNKDIEIISISVDRDHDAWKEALDRHNPSWPQYIISEDDNARLSDALNIVGIPRFIILRPDGTIYDKEAKRPSEGESTISDIFAAL